jgi:hypothetical protein
MTVLATLALNVDYVKLIGAAGEPEFGSPRTLDNHNDLNEWIEGLRAGDGSGSVLVVPTPLNQGLIFCRNVLRLRKAKSLARECGESSVTETSPIHERRDDGSSKRADVRHYAAPSEHKEDWREVCCPPYGSLHSSTYYHCLSPSQRSHCDITSARQGIVLLVSRPTGE